MSIKRNRIDVLGHDCQFVRCLVGHRYSWGYADTVYVVKLDGVFAGIVRSERSNGWNFVGCSPSGMGLVLRGSSRVKAVAQYVERYLCKSPENSGD